MAVKFNQSNSLFFDFSKELQTGNYSQTPLLSYSRGMLSLDVCENSKLTLSHLKTFNQTASHLVRVMNQGLKRRTKSKEYVQELDGMFKTCEKMIELYGNMHKRLRAKLNKTRRSNFTKPEELNKTLEKLKEKVEAKTYKVLGQGQKIEGFSGSQSLLTQAITVNRDSELALELIEKGVTVDPSCSEAQKALDCALCYGMKDVLLKLDLEVLNFADKNGDTLLHKALKIDQKIALALIQKGVNVNVQNKKQETALMIACEDGLDEAILALLEKKALVAVENCERETPLELALKTLHVETTSITETTTLKLVEKCEEVQFFEKRDRDGNTLLSLACKYGQEAILYKLLERGAKLDVVNKRKETPLILALENLNDDIDGDFTVTTLLHLIENGADIHKADCNGNTPLHLACRYGFDPVVAKLIEKGAKVEVENVDEETPLFLAIQQNLLSLGSYVELLENGADVKRVDDDGNTALHLAAEIEGLEFLVKKLIERGADYNSVNKEGDTPLHRASFNAVKETIKMLLEKGALPNIENKKTETPLICGLKKEAYFFSTIIPEREDAFILLIDKADVHKKDSDGNTALHLISKQRGLKRAAEKLLEKGAEINARNGILETPLHKVLGGWDKELAQLFIERGADLQARDKMGNSPLHISCLSDELLDVSLTLLERGANIEALNTYGRAPLHQACRSPSSEITALALIERGADINKMDFFQDSPFSLALKGGLEKASGNLLAMDARIESKEHENYSPFLAACSSGLEDIALELIERGVNVHKLSKDVNKNAISYLAECTKICPRLFTKLIELEVEFDLVDLLGLTPLLKACQNFHKDVALKLIELGANVHHEINSETALHIASRKSHMAPVVKKLVEGGCDIHKKNKSGKTCLSVADPLIAVDLIDYGANFSEVYETVDELIENSSSNDDAKLILKLLEKGVKSSDEKASENLFRVCSKDKNPWQEVALQLIEVDREYDPHNRGDTSFNAFQMACQSGMSEVVKKLIELHADIHEVSEGGSTTLHLAVESKNEELALFLIDQEVDIHKTNERGRTAFSFACYNGMPKVIEKLLEKGVGKKDFVKECGSSSQNTPLHYLFKNGIYEVLKFVPFEDNSIDILVRNQKGETPFDLALHSLKWIEDAPRMKQFFKQLFSKFPKLCERIEAEKNTDFLAYLNEQPDALMASLPSGNPFEVAFFFNDVELARALAKKMDSGVLMNHKAALEKTYKASNADEFLFKMLYDVNPTHMTKGLYTEPIPQKPPGSDLQDLLKLFDLCNFSDSNKVGFSDPKAFLSDTNTVSPLELRRILERFIDTVRNKRGFLGEPNKDSQSYHDFYNTIENAYTAVAFELLSRDKTLPNEQARTETAIEILRDVGLCGPRVFSTGVRLFHKVVRKVEPTFENQIFGALAHYRSLVLDSLVPVGLQSLHDHVILMKTLGLKLGIPGASAFTDFDDMYSTSGEGVDAKQSEQFFHRIYNSFNILMQIVDQIESDEEFRQKYSSWWKKRAPKEWGKNFHDDIRAELSRLDPKSSREEVEKLFEKHDLYLGKNQTVDQALEDTRTHRFVEQEVYEDTSKNRFRRNFIIQMLEELEVLIQI